MPTNKQRREAERRRLQRQLEQRRQREIARRRFTLISSVVGTLAVIVVVIVIVIATTGNDSSGKKKAAGASKASTSPASSAAPSAAPSSSTAPVPTAACAGPSKGATASYKGVSVGYATDLKHEPKVRAKSSAVPTTLECQDLVVGTGKAASAGATVSVQYTGVLYANGKQFDSSWGKAGAKPASFQLDPTKVIPGFNQGIGGAGKVAPMKIGGRRTIIMPASLAYGSTGNGAVPANAALVFVVDLKSVKA